jgi:uncharacterized protein DUF2752
MLDPFYLFFMSLRFKLYYRFSVMVFLAITPVILLLLPATFFDHGQSLCISQLLFHRACPACGMTRGCMHLIHLDFENAFAYNMMSFIVLPLMGVVWVQWFIKEYKIYKLLKAKLAEEPKSDPS